MNEEEKKIALKLGEKIKEAREALGLSQEEAAELTKLHHIHFGRLKRGEVNMKVATLFKLEVLSFYDFKFTDNTLQSMIYVPYRKERCTTMF